MDNSFIVQNLLQQKEGIRLEFKANPDLDIIARIITAFINTQGGDLVVGIDEDKKVVGVEKAESKAIEISDYLIKHIRPTAPIAVQLISFRTKELILISVWEGANKPYHYNNTFYERIESDTKQVTRHRLVNLISDRKQADSHWERMAVLGADISDLNISEVEVTMKSYRNYTNDVDFNNAEDFLIRLGLIQNGNITNACIVLFGKYPTQFIPQSRVRITLYPSKKSESHFIDDRIFEGNIFENISKVLSYLDNIYGRSASVNKVLRTEKGNYPILAMREGLLNAIVHSDYNSASGHLQISVFSDRTEISNYGRLPEGITVDDLRVEHHSILRNPDIAQMCFIRKYIEMLGSGTLRMINDCKVHRFKEPIWLVKGNHTTVVFPGVTHGRKSDGVNDGVNDGVSDGVNRLIDAGVKEGVVRTVVGSGVRAEVVKIVTLVLSDEGINISEIIKKIKKPKPTIERYLKIAKDVGLIEFRGVPKTGGYYLTGKMKDLNL